MHACRRDTISCPPSVNTAFLLVGLALPAGGVVFPLPPSVACVNPTGIGIDITLPILNPGVGSIVLPIPPIASFEFAAQCLFIPLGGTCVDLSTAARVAVRP